MTRLKFIKNKNLERDLFQNVFLVSELYLYKKLIYYFSQQMAEAVREAERTGCKELRDR